MDLPPESVDQPPPDLDEQDLETLLGSPAAATPGDATDDVQPTPPRHRSRYLPAILDALIPGLGHLVVGRWRRAILFVSPLLLGLITAAWIVATTSGPRLAASLLSNEVIWGLLAAQGLLLASRLIAVGSSLFDPALPRPGRRDLLPIALLLVFVIAPQAYAGYATEIAREAADEIFVGPTTAVVPTVSAAPDPSFLSTPAPGLPSPSPSVDPGSQRVTALVIGVDSGVGRNTYLTDTMIIVSLDRATQTVSMLSIPRDMVDVPMADGRTYRDKINSLVAYARHHPEQFPGSNGTGFDVLMGALGTLTQVPIDYYAKVDLGGFVRVVDVLGGVDVNVAHGFCDPAYDEYGFANGFSITAGRHHLNGQQALAYARVRKASGESDFTRAARQQEVISGIRDSIVHGGFLNDPIGLLLALGKTVETNVPRDLLPDLADLATQVGREQTYRAVVTHPLVGSGFDVRGSIQVPDVPAIRALAAKLFPTDGSLPSADYALPKPSSTAVSGSGVAGCQPAPKPKPTPAPKPSSKPSASASAGPSVEPSGSTPPAASGEPSATPGPTPETPAPRRQPASASRSSSVSWGHSTRKASWPLVDRISR